MPRRLSGRVQEDTPFALFALLQRDDGTTDLIPGDVTTFDIRIFDECGDTPDTAIWTRLAEDPTGVLTVRQDPVLTAPNGYNWKYQIAKAAVDDNAVALALVGGRTYLAEVILNSAQNDVNGVVSEWEMSCQSGVTA